MRIAILGRGPLAEPLAQLAERAGHTVRRVEEAAAASGAQEAPELVILAGSTTAIEAMLSSLAPSLGQEAVVVDATIPTQDERGGGDQASEKAQGDWLTTALPRARIVRAFASVPPEALSAVLGRPVPEEEGGRLAVPIAGNDHQANELVSKFIRSIGAEPFDLGALANAAPLDPGGALWGKALNQIEMMETVGWLSGDG